MTSKLFPHHWPLVMRIHRSPVDSTHKGPLMQTFGDFLGVAWTSCLVNSRYAGDLCRHDAHATSLYVTRYGHAMMTSSNGNIFSVTGHLPVNSSHKGQWRGALMFSLICARMNGWVNNGEAGDLRRYCAHYDVTIITCKIQDSKIALLLPIRHSIQYSHISTNYKYQ